MKERFYKKSKKRRAALRPKITTLLAPPDVTNAKIIAHDWIILL